MRFGEAGTSAFNFARSEFGRLRKAADAMPLPKPKPRAVCEHLIVSSIALERILAVPDTRPLPQNSPARSGDVVRIVVTDHQDRRPVEDILCTDEAYRIIY